MEARIGTGTAINAAAVYEECRRLRLFFITVEGDTTTVPSLRSGRLSAKSFQNTSVLSTKLCTASWTSCVKDDQERKTYVKSGLSPRQNLLSGRRSSSSFATYCNKEWASCVLACDARSLNAPCHSCLPNWTTGGETSSGDGWPGSIWQDIERVKEVVGEGREITSVRIHQR